jgi:hypothetical protein
MLNYSLSKGKKMKANKLHKLLRRILSALLISLLAGCGVVRVAPPKASPTPRPRLSVPTNLDFEETQPGGRAKDWWANPREDYVLEIVGSPTKSGAHSAHIKYLGGEPGPGEDFAGEDPDWASMDQYYDMRPHIGKTVRVKAWIKASGTATCPKCDLPGQTTSMLSDEEQGAEVRLLIYGEGSNQALDYTAITPLVTGTRDWTLFEAQASVPEGSSDLILATILWGKGEAWFDALELSVT